MQLSAIIRLSGWASAPEREAAADEVVARVSTRSRIFSGALELRGTRTNCIWQPGGQKRRMKASPIA